MFGGQGFRRDPAPAVVTPDPRYDQDTMFQVEFVHGQHFYRFLEGGTGRQITLVKQPVQALWYEVIQWLEDSGIDMTTKWLVCSSATGYRHVDNIQDTLPLGLQRCSQNSVYHEALVMVYDFKHKIQQCLEWPVRFCPACGINRHVCIFPGWEFRRPVRISVCFLCAGEDARRFYGAEDSKPYDSGSVRGTNAMQANWPEYPHKPALQVYDHSYAERFEPGFHRP